MLDLEPLEHNIDKMAGHFRERGVQWRPHAKAFKCPAIAHILRRAGAIGVTVAKVSEAEVMAAGGITDILIAHLVVGPSKLARLAALQKQADVKVTVDHPDHVVELSRAAEAAGVTIGVLVDVDLGMKRTGVPTERRCGHARPAGFGQPRFAVRRLDGLRGPYPHDRRPGRKARGHQRRRSPSCSRLATWWKPLATLAGSSRPAALGRTSTPPTSPGSPRFRPAAESSRASTTRRCARSRAICPHLSVLATVVSRPARDRAILDIGQKSISQHQTPPILRDYPNCRVTGLSAEHATIAVDSQNDLPIGEKVHVIPGYSDFTFVLHDRVLGLRHGRVEAVWELLGRGKLQ